MDSATLILWICLFPIERMSANFIITMCIETPVFNEDSAGPDLTPRFAASDPGLHRLPYKKLGING